MKSLKSTVSVLYIILALAGGISVTSCSDDFEEVTLEIPEMRGTEDDDTPPPPPCTGC